jgi:hypothetical protein
MTTPIGIKVGNGVLDRFFARLSQGTIDAYVTYSLSNGASYENAHLGVPLAAVTANAATNGRAEWAPSDLCAVIAAAIPQFDGTISPAAIPAPAAPQSATPPTPPTPLTPGVA